MRRSEIFESFVKIAEEKGLISNDSSEAKKALEADPRADSLSVDDIAHLYGVKPKSPPGTTYQKNIMEVAHPEPIVIAPSYDKLNGLVENNIERQNILLHIVNKNNDGQLTNTKYAQKKLALSLIRIGNEMDTRHQGELRKLSDVCLRQAASSTIKKQAIIPLLIGIGALVGAIYAKEHLPSHTNGLEMDYQKLMSELEDFKNSSVSWGGLFGTSYTASFMDQVKDIEAKTAELVIAAKKLMPILDQLDTPQTGSQLASLSQTSQAQQAVSALSEFGTIWHNLQPYLEKVLSDFKSEQFKIRQVTDKGFFQKMVDSTNILHGGYGLFNDDFDDVVQALQVFVNDVKTIAEELINTAKIANDTQQKVNQTTSSGPDEVIPASTTSAPIASNPVERTQAKSLLQQLEENPDLIGI